MKDAKDMHKKDTSEQLISIDQPVRCEIFLLRLIIRVLQLYSMTTVISPSDLLTTTRRLLSSLKDNIFIAVYF